MGRKKTAKSKNKMIILTMTIIGAIIIILIIILLGNQNKCPNTCASDNNQKPQPSCLCYKDVDDDLIPDVIDLNPNEPLVPVVEGDEGFIDSDGDGWDDLTEEQWGSNPNDENDFPYQDMDGDGFYDEEEIFYGTDPNDADDFPIFDEPEPEQDLPTEPPETPEPPVINCFDSDGILNLDSQIVTDGFCEDETGKFFDECLINSDTLSEWGCENNLCKRTNLNCVDWLGIGASCTTGNKKCTTPITYTSSECESLRIENSRERKGIVENQDACDDRAFFVCDLQIPKQASGIINWFPSNCCLYDCIDI